MSRLLLMVFAYALFIASGCATMGEGPGMMRMGPEGETSSGPGLFR